MNGQSSLPKQRPYEQALSRGFDRLTPSLLSGEHISALGGTLNDSIISLPALSKHLEIDLTRREVFIDGNRAATGWAVLSIHYLSASNLKPDMREVSFSHFQDCRTYLSVFGKRILGRFLATSGRTSEQFIKCAEQNGGTKVPSSGTGYRFNVLPRVPITINRYDGDEETGPGASVIYRADAENLLPAEDRVVAAELLLDVLSGKPMTATHDPIPASTQV